MPAGLVNGNLVRHLHLLEYYLEQGQPEACRNDIDEICRTDLPKLEQALRARGADQEHHDAEFADKLRRLLADQHLDSAVRKAFVILKERMINADARVPSESSAHMRERAQ